MKKKFLLCVFALAMLSIVVTVMALTTDCCCSLNPTITWSNCVGLGCGATNIVPGGPDYCVWSGSLVDCNISACAEIIYNPTGCNFQGNHVDDGDGINVCNSNTNFTTYLCISPNMINVANTNCSEYVSNGLCIQTNWRNINCMLGVPCSDPTAIKCNPVNPNQLLSCDSGIWTPYTCPNNGTCELDQWGNAMCSGGVCDGCIDWETSPLVCYPYGTKLGCAECNNITKIFLNKDSNCPSGQICQNRECVVTTTTMTPIPAVNQTEWQEAGFGWATIFFTPIFLATLFSGVVSAITGAIGGPVVAGGTFMIFLLVLTISGVYPAWIGIVMIIIAGFILAKTIPQVIGGK